MPAFSRKRQWTDSSPPGRMPRKHGGDFRRIVEGVNATLDSLVGFIDTMPLPVMVHRSRPDDPVHECRGCGDRWEPPTEMIGKKCFDHFRTDHCTSGECACLRAWPPADRSSARPSSRPGTANCGHLHRRTDQEWEAERGRCAGDRGGPDRDQTCPAGRRQGRCVPACAGGDAWPDDLHKLSTGDLNLQLFVAPGDKDTAEVRSNFERINERLDLARQGGGTPRWHGIDRCWPRQRWQGSLRPVPMRAKHNGEFRGSSRG